MTELATLSAPVSTGAAVRARLRELEDGAVVGAFLDGEERAFDELGERSVGARRPAAACVLLVERADHERRLDEALKGVGVHGKRGPLPRDAGGRQRCRGGP